MSRKNGYCIECDDFDKNSSTAKRANLRQLNFPAPFDLRDTSRLKEMHRTPCSSSISTMTMGAWNTVSMSPRGQQTSPSQSYSRESDNSNNNHPPGERLRQLATQEGRDLLPPVLDSFSLVQGFLDAPVFGGNKYTNSETGIVRRHARGAFNSSHRLSISRWPCLSAKRDTTDTTRRSTGCTVNTTFSSLVKSCTPFSGNWPFIYGSALPIFDR